jgi:hypothetical protein
MTTADRIMKILDKYWVDVRLAGIQYAELVIELDDLCLKEYERGQREGPVR